MNPKRRRAPHDLLNTLQVDYGKYVVTKLSGSSGRDCRLSMKNFPTFPYGTVGYTCQLSENEVGSTTLSRLRDSSSSCSIVLSGTLEREGVALAVAERSGEQVAGTCCPERGRNFRHLLRVKTLKLTRSMSLGCASENG